MKSPFRIFTSTILLLPISIVAQGQEPDVESERLPRIPPKSPQEALAAFEIKEGFKIELVASEPLTTDPVAISFDAHGRMFTCEMRGYSERREAKLGRVRMLTDDNGDGIYDSATTYTEGLKWPTAIICWNGGVFVGASPDIWWFKDTNNDGVADEKRLVFTGFAEGLPRLNVQGLLNSFVWGPDWRIHGSSSLSGGHVRRPDDPEAEAVNLRGHNFSFDPVKFDLRMEAGAAQYGMAFDDDGQRFVCSNSSHIEAVIYSWPWLDLDLPHPRVPIAVDGGAAEVYRTSAVEPWRIVRTEWRVQGLVGGPIEGGGRDSGYFTSASGLGIYRGDAFPDGYRGNEFVGDVGSNLVHRKIITRANDRVAFRAERPRDEQTVEFLTSTDNWFRPVMCTNGPGGALYIVDMYRETIEHPWSIPENIKKHLDLNNGFDKGRIWRVVPDGFRYPENVSLAMASPAQLVQALESLNAWRRETASQRLLASGQTEGLRSDNIAGLYGLYSLGRLNEPLLELAIAQSDTKVRRHAVRLASQISVDPTLIDKLVRDPDPWVRFEAALLFTRTDLYPKDQLSIETLVKLAQSSPEDPWMHQAVTEAGSKRLEVAGLFQRLWQANQHSPILATLATKARSGDWPAIASCLTNAQLLDSAVRILERLPFEINPKSIDSLLERAMQESSKASWWLRTLDPRTPAESIWNQLAGTPESVPLLFPRLIKRDQWEHEAMRHWATLPAAARDAVLTKLSPDILLEFIDSGTIQANEVGIPLRARLRNHSSNKIRQQARRLLGEPESRSRQKAATKYRSALRLPGQSQQGRVIYEQRCVTCHELPGSKEMNAGPNLSSFVNKGKAALLEHILSPNLEVSPQYSMWQVTMNDGTSHAGLLAQETATKVVLRQAGRLVQTLNRAELKSMTNLNQSLMPPGLEEGLSLQQMADLLAYILEPR